MNLPLTAVIFDLDGVLVDSEPIFRAGLRQYLAPDPLTDEQYESIIGISAEETWRWVQRTYGRTQSVEEMSAASSSFIYGALEAAEIEPLTGATELVAALRAEGCGLGVASQSSPRWVARMLEGTGLASAFDVVVTSSEVMAPKPAPDIYLRAASLLGVPASACIAVEDSPSGIASAHAAGMTVVQLRQCSHVPPPHELASYVLASHDAFPMDLVRKAPQ